VKIVEHEDKQLGVPGFCSEDMTGYGKCPFVLALENADPERLFEVNGKYGAHPNPPGTVMPAREWTALIASAEGGIDGRWLLRATRPPPDYLPARVFIPADE
jgi:hypothetical protein